MGYRRPHPQPFNRAFRELAAFECLCRQAHPAAPEEGAVEATAVAAEDNDAASETQSGDLTGLSREAAASDESVEELIEEGQFYEAEVVDGVENAPPADEAEVTTHERPEVEGESVPDEELPGEQR